MPATPDEVRSFLRSHHRCVLVTRKRDGEVQSSPVIAGVDSAGRIVISATDDRAKVQNLRRSRRATVCAFTDDFFGPWVQGDGDAEVIVLPDAMGPLVNLYRQVVGEHEDWDSFGAAMRAENRVLIRIDLDEDRPPPR